MHKVLPVQHYRHEADQAMSSSSSTLSLRRDDTVAASVARDQAASKARCITLHTQDDSAGSAGCKPTISGCMRIGGKSSGCKHGGVPVAQALCMLKVARRTFGLPMEKIKPSFPEGPQLSDPIRLRPTLVDQSIYESLQNIVQLQVSG